MLLASIPSPPVGGIDLGFTEVRVYGILIATAVLIAATWTRKRYERFGGDPELADRITIWAVVIAFLGARLAYVAPRVDRFIDDPIAIIRIWEGGLALFGGWTFGLLTLLILLRRWDMHQPSFFDALAPTLPLAQAIGRWGNYFNQELYGTPTTLPWALEIDPANRVTPYQQFETFHPTFLYESLANLVLMGVILRLERSGKLARGSLLAVYAIGYGVIRFAMEMIRTDTTFRFLGLSRNAMVALVLVIGGSLFLRWWQGRPQPEPAVDGEGSAEGAVDPEPSEASAVLVGIATPEEQDGTAGDERGDGDEGDDAAADPVIPD